MKKKLKNIQESGFKVPKTYFENFEASILSQANLKEKASEAGFTVPEGYFDEVEKSILSKTNKKEPTKVISLLNKRNIIYISSIAAAILLLFNLSLFNNTFNFDSLETEAVDDFVLNNFELNDFNILFSNTELSESAFIDYNLSDETLDYYLETIDETDFILD